MKKARKLKLFPKTFISILVLMMSFVVVSFLLLYALMPEFYKTFKRDQLASNADKMVSSLIKKTVEQLYDELMQYSGRYGLGIVAKNDQGDILFETGLRSEILSYESANVNESIDVGIYTESVIIIENNFINEQRSFINSDGERIWLDLTMSLQPVDDAAKVILSVLPYVLVICVFLAAVVSYFYSKTITKPIKAISAQTVRMRALDKNAYCKKSNGDEIGDLAENINVLYGLLLDTISNLQNENKNIAKAEKDKIDFLLMASHELKTPLTAVSGIIEGMIYNIGIYQDRDTWLIECKNIIDQLSALLRELLDISKLNMSLRTEDICKVEMSQYIKDILKPYSIIALSKHIELSFNTDNSFTTEIPHVLLSKALSNILSNAVNYTDENKAVRLFFVDRNIVIENECEPLSAEQMQDICKPFYRPDYSHNKDTGGNGLGLYITDRILKICKIEYKFVPYSKGMRFTLYLKD